MRSLKTKKTQNQNGLTASLKKYAKNISFHTPGHSNKLKSLAKLDTTELCYSGNLLEAQGITKELEDKISRVYKAESAYISTNGATNCILTAVYTLKDYGGFLIFGQVHTSVYNALQVSKAMVFDCDTLPDTPPQGVKTLIFTYPDYFGKCADLAAIKAYCEKHNLYLFVDSSHGSHFIFSSKFPHSATNYADMVACSLHKTLPVATGGAVLLCNKEEFSDKLSLSRKLFHSTSPSYITMSSIDSAISCFANKGVRLYDKVFAAIERFTEADIGNFKIEKTDDTTRFVLVGKFCGAAVSAELFKRRIDMEMSFENKVVAIVTPYNCKKLPRLSRALKKISELSLPEWIASEKKPKIVGLRLVEPGGEFELVPLAESVGRTAYCDMGVYPPGVPFIKAGETITAEAAELLKKNPLNSFGLVNGRAAVLLYKNGGL